MKPITKFIYVMLMVNLTIKGFSVSIRKRMG